MFSELPEIMVCVESSTVSEEQREMRVGRSETETVSRRKEKQATSEENTSGKKCLGIC